ncbi:hypothetical protein VTO73DRAFT_5134 [Trametes versicolor]
MKILRPDGKPFFGPDHGDEILVPALLHVDCVFGCVQLKESDHFWEAIISSLGTIDENQPPGRPPDSCRLSLNGNNRPPEAAVSFR